MPRDLVTKTPDYAFGRKNRIWQIFMIILKSVWWAFTAEFEGIFFPNVLFSVTQWATFSLCLRQRRDQRCTERLAPVTRRRRAGAGRPLCVSGYQLSTYFVCAVISPTVIHGGGWKTPALTQIHRNPQRDKTMVKLTEKPLINVSSRRVGSPGGERRGNHAPKTLISPAR